MQQRPGPAALQPAALPGDLVRMFARSGQAAPGRAGRARAAPSSAGAPPTIRTGRQDRAGLDVGSPRPRAGGARRRAGARGRAGGGEGRTQGRPGRRAGGARGAGGCRGRRGGRAAAPAGAGVLRYPTLNLILPGLGSRSCDERGWPACEGRMSHDASVARSAEPPAAAAEAGERRRARTLPARISGSLCRPAQRRLACAQKSG